MAETEYATTTRLPIDAIWEFVRDMDNWAPFLAGYQRHQRESETESVWTVKGDIGVLARTVVFKVRITEWNGPERVAFTLEGVNEQLGGEGSFTVEPHADATAMRPGRARPRLHQRCIDALVRFLFRLRHGKSQRPPADPGPGTGGTRMTFRLRVDPGGPTAPMVDAMMRPALPPAAEQLADRIVTHLEALHGTRSGDARA